MQLVKQVTHGGCRMDKQHTGPYIAHHAADVLLAVRGIAMYGTLTAARLGIAVGTPVKAAECVVAQGGTLLTQPHSASVVTPAVKRNHQLHH